MLNSHCNKICIYSQSEVLNMLNILQTIIAGKVMGVTDFINPKDLTKPVHEVLSTL